MTTLSMPEAPKFINSKFGLQANTQKHESPLSRHLQRIALSGARWMLSVSLPSMSREQAAPWQSFFVQCEGQANAFYGFDPDARLPRGAALLQPGTPLVAGGSQTGSSLNIDGAPANITGWLLPGDYFTVNGEMKMVTAQVNTNGSGEATISFKPAMRSSPADNAPLTVHYPTCTMVMVDDEQGVWQGNKHSIYEGVSFSAIEVF